MAAQVDHSRYILLALEQARLSPPKPTNYCVGAVLVDQSNGTVLATGYTLELPGNTHAEQCCLEKFAKEHGVSEESIGEILPPETVIYTTMEPCIERLSGNLPCVDRIIRVSRGGRGIKTVYSGVTEPDTFVKQNSGRSKLENEGIGFVHVPGHEEDILSVATAGHDKTQSGA